jgi:hypothetical protein
VSLRDFSEILQCSYVAVREVLEKVKFKFVVVQPGDYAVKAGLDNTIAHRNAVLDFVTEDSRFVVLYHDELNTTVNIGQARAWMKIGEVHVDLRKKSGAGLGKGFYFFSFFFYHLFRYYLCVCFFWILLRVVFSSDRSRCSVLKKAK